MRDPQQATAADAARSRQPGYNYQRLPAGFWLHDLRRTVRGGPEPGSPAPDFELLTTEGEAIRLSSLRGSPVVLVFGSITCPVTRGAVPALNKLYHQTEGQSARWYWVYVREAHPGENYPAPQTYEEKREHARQFKRLEDIPCPVLVDRLDGAVHQAYGELPNAAYVIDADGRIAFKDAWASAVTLGLALDALQAHGGRDGPVAGGQERLIHVLGPLAFGWPAIHRAGPAAIHDLAIKMPLLAGAIWAGQFLRPVLTPLATRSQPLPTPAKAAAALAAAGGLAVFLRRRTSRESVRRGVRLRRVVDEGGHDGEERR